MDHQLAKAIATAVAELDCLAGKVGLIRVDKLPEVKEVTPPIGAALWASSYAQLLLWPAAQEDVGGLANSAAAGEAWLDDWLLRTERGARGRTVDGYLVLALPTAPEEDEREQIRRLELSAHVCRKHLIWPAASSEDDTPTTTWARLGDITMLGLPEAAAPPKAELEWPELDAEAMAVWTDLASLGPAATLQKDDA